MKIDQDRVEHLRARLHAIAPDFEDFASPGELYRSEEDEYKRRASARARERLAPYVDGSATFDSGDAAAKLAWELFDLTNFLNWRDKSYIHETLLATGDAWLEFWRPMLDVLRAGEDWRAPFGRLLEVITARDCAANITKILPTYIPFLWAPELHMAIKSQMFDRFLGAIGVDRLGQGVNLTVDGYAHAIEACAALREALADWGPRDNIDVHNVIWLTLTKRTAAGPSPSKTEPERGDAPTLPLNLILAGPPGTGKSHRLLAYRRQFESKASEISDAARIRTLVADLTWWQSCAVALAVADRPMTVPELAATDVIQAKASFSTATTIGARLWVNLMVHTPERCDTVQYTRRRAPFLFWKDDKSTWTFAPEARELAPDLFAIAEEIRNPTTGQIQRRYELVTFHPSYGYEDFVEGIKPVTEGHESDDAVGYDVVPGVFRRIVDDAMKDPDARFALFIDEVNRASTADVFGELITLIEPDKRMRWSPEARDWVDGVRVKLPYTHTMKPTEPLFGIPNNLHIIATMNTADRSIALIDYALRRRFAFEEVVPNPHVLTRTVPSDDGGADIDLSSILARMNERITYLMDRDHALGHAYLMPVETLDDLELVFRRQILPLLQEYFHEDWEKVQLVLDDLIASSDKDGRPKAHPDAIVVHSIEQPNRLFRAGADTLSPRRTYAIADELTAASFRKIYANE